MRCWSDSPLRDIESTITYSSELLPPSMSGAYSGPRNPNPAEGESSIIIYGYIPSLPLAIVAVITFAATLLTNAWYMNRKGKGSRSFHGLLAFGSVCSTPAA